MFQANHLLIHRDRKSLEWIFEAFDQRTLPVLTGSAVDTNSEQWKKIVSATSFCMVFMKENVSAVYLFLISGA